MATRMDVAVVEVPVGGPEGAVAAWPVHWSAAWVGALTALATAVVIGLFAVALGAYDVVAPGRFGPANLDVGDVIAAVCGAFFSFAAGGWVASRVAGFRRADSAALHGAIAWLIAVPLVIVLVALGAGGLFGAWYVALGGTPAWVATPPPAASVAVVQAARKAAGGAATALLLGLVGAVLGGWLGSGEPMDPMHHYRKWRDARVSAPTP